MEEVGRDIEGAGMLPHFPEGYKQKISSYKVTFYDMDDNEIEIDEYYMKQSYSELDQAIYEWENEE